MACAVQPDPKEAKSVYEFSASDIKGEEVKLEKYRGHVLVIVNVASKCGYTAQHYKELNELYDELADKGK
jgi:phospholipid-hydroperoxide glutathione peroxidase